MTRLRSLNDKLGAAEDQSVPIQNPFDIVQVPENVAENHKYNDLV
jgi:hypothetical protein